MPDPTSAVRTQLRDPAIEINYRPVSGEFIGEAFSLDPFAGGTANDRPIFNLTQINENLNRTGWDWYTNNDGVLSTTDTTINFGFWNSRNDFFGTGYISDQGNIAFQEFFDFGTGPTARGIYSAAQRAVARTTMALWDDIVSVTFAESSVADADIRFGNTNTRGAQAYAYLPFGDIFFDEGTTSTGAYYSFSNLADLGGDVWTDYNVASNFNPLRDSYYSVITMIHEAGHALGLSHPGDYNALDDDDGDGVPDPITYENDAFYAQDSLQYTVMSYFDALETGAQHVDWTLMNFAYAATPLVHDISALQRIYGVDTTTRTGDTVYGFNSTADRAAYDFTQNTRPIVTIWDAGGNDTIDFSGWNTPSTIDLNEGSFSSGGGIENFLTLAEINANRAAIGFGARTQAQYDLYLTQFNATGSPLYRDNISIAYGAVIENARGGGGNDLIIANRAANRIDGGAGSDTVSYETMDGRSGGIVVSIGADVFGAGAAAGDRLISIENVTGTRSNDVIVGDGGNNTIDGGAGGRDVMYGGRGIDTLSYASATESVVLNLQNGRTGGASIGDVYYDFENIIGTGFEDTLDGNSGANKIWGGAGGDRIQGNNGNDDLYGEGGNDIIAGNSGDDRITGGAGGDRMTGDQGNDVFIFTAIEAQTDVIVDFTRGRDRIDLSAIDAIAGTTADDAFSFIGSSAFSNVAGQLRFAGGFLTGDVNGDGVADFTIQLSGVTVLGVPDVVL